MAGYTWEDIERELDALDEEDEASGVPSGEASAVPPMPNFGQAELDTARDQRDHDTGTANFMQGLTDIGAGMASQGRMRANPSAFESARQSAATRATEVERDTGNKRKMVQEYLKRKQGLVDRDNENAASDQVIQQLYPGLLPKGSIKKLPTNTISNIFKVIRQKEAIKARRTMKDAGTLGVPTSQVDLIGAPGRGPKAGGGSGGANPFPRKEVTKYQFELNKATKDLRPIVAASQTIVNFADLAKKNPTASAGLPVLLARAVGEKGPLSNFDVQMWGGSQAVIARLHRSASILATGKLPVEDLEFIKEVGAALSAEAKRRLKETEERATNQFTANYGGEPGENFKLLTGSYQADETAGEKKVVRKQANKARTKTKIFYSDGTTEIVDGVR